MKISLNDLIRPVHAEFNAFQHEFEDMLKSHVFLINQVMRYVVAQKGKKLRPLLLLLAAKLRGECASDTYRAACLVEALHTATLVHDDVVDEAETRRGLPSINSIWRNKVSVLIGDYLFSKALINMVKIGNPKLLTLLSTTAEKLVTGEIDQIDRARSDSMTEEAYFQMIDDKTASLLAAGCQLGIMTSSEDEADWQALHDYGHNFGIAFQLKDDLFDFEGRESSVGKPIGLDLKHNMVTLPLIHTFSQITPAEQKQIKRSLSKGKDSANQKMVLELVKRTGGLDHAKLRLREYSDRAIQSLERFPDTAARHSLIQFVEFNIQREK